MRDTNAVPRYSDSVNARRRRQRRRRRTPSQARYRPFLELLEARRVLAALPFEVPGEGERNGMAMVGALKSAQLVGDLDQDGRGDIGDVIQYEVTIRNMGMQDAQNVQFVDNLDPNLQLVPGSLRVTPIAVDDFYRVTPETPLNVNLFDGLLANDFDIDGSQPLTNVDLQVLPGSVQRVGGTSSGTINVNSDGTFTYDPPPGDFQGTETFTYSITDGDDLSSQEPGFVTFTIGGLIWFIDNSRETNGDGSLSNPFNSLGPVNGLGGIGDVDQPGDTIFLFRGLSTYDGGIELETNQQFLGEGAGLFFNNTMVVPPGLPPTLTNSAGNGIDLASGNTIRGLNISGTQGLAIVGNGINGATIDRVSVSSSGIDLQNTTGSFTFSDTRLDFSGPGPVLRVDNHTGGTFDFGPGSLIDATNGIGLQFNNANGTYSFNGPVKLSGGDAGIDILGNSNGTFTFGNTDIDYSGPGAAVNVDGHKSGTIIFGPGSTIGATNGSGLQFNNADGVYLFNGATQLGGSDAGIDIIGGSGTFTFGNTDIDYSGPGAAVNVNGHHTGTVTFGPGTTIDATNGSGLQFNKADGTSAFDGSVSLDGGDAGIDIIGDSGGTFTFSGLTSITDPSGTAFFVQDLKRNGTIDFDGSIQATGSAGNAVNYFRLRS